MNIVDFLVREKIYHYQDHVLSVELKYRRDKTMKTKKYGIYIDDDLVHLAMTEDRIFFGIEAAKALDIEEFGKMLDHTIDHCVIEALGIPIDADTINNAADIISQVRNAGTVPEHINRVRAACQRLKEVAARSAAERKETHHKR